MHLRHHGELINLIAKKIRAQVYIEIGVFNPERNFTKINVENKIGVDPDPNSKATLCIDSDTFFRRMKQTGGKADLIWIDGLHHADQVKKDIENAWDMLNIGGVMAIHDSNPHSEGITHVPRDSREWTGDVYKTISRIDSPYYFTMDFDYGCCVIRKTKDSLRFRENEVTWEAFDRDRRTLLNLVSVAEGVNIIESWT